MGGIWGQLLEGAGKGIFLALWVIGTAMALGPPLRLLYSRLRRRGRLRSLHGPGKQGDAFRLHNLPVIRHLASELEMAEIKLRVEALVAIIALLFSTGVFFIHAAVYALHQEFATGTELLASVNAWLLSFSVGFLFGGLPVFYVKFRIQKKRHRIAGRMIMLVQNLLGHYNSAQTIAETLAQASATMPAEVQKEWSRLILNLHMKTTEQALYEFARRIENQWAEDLADLLIMASHYGMDITGALHKLVSAMQTAKRNEEKRMAMITVYRIGTLVMIGFAFFVVLFNLYADRSNYKHYFLEGNGKMLLAVSTLVMFLSLVMVVRSGRKPF